MTGVLDVAPENTKHLENVHTFAGCAIYQSSAGADAPGRLHMVWADAASYTLIRDLHQYNAKQSRQFYAYIAAVHSSTVANITELGGIADGRFIFEDKTYCVRGRYIYPIERLDDQLNAVAVKLYWWYDAKKDHINAEFKYMYGSHKMYSMQDILTIWAKVMGLVKSSCEVHTLTDPNNIRYVYQIWPTVPDTSNDHFYPDTIHDFINSTTCPIEHSDEVKDTHTKDYISAFNYTEPSSGGNTYSVGIYTSHAVCERYELKEGQGICCPSTCMQMIYHMPDIMKCANHNANTGVWGFVDILSKHIQDMKHAYMTEYQILEKYDRWYKWMVKLYKNTINNSAEYQDFCKKCSRQIPTVRYHEYHDMYYMLSKLYTESREIAMYIGSEYTHWTNDDLVLDCMLYIKSDETVWQSITNKCRDAPTHQPYIIVWLPMVCTQAVVCVQTWDTIPVCVVNTITNTPFRLTGSMTATPRHTYYVDYANRVVYDGPFTYTTPNAMYRKDKSSFCNEHNFVAEEYIEVIQYNYALLYVRDVI